MKRAVVIRKVLKRLEDEWALYVRAARTAHAEATDEQSRAENKYDTRGLEASYLARGQSRQARELEEAIVRFRNLSTAPRDPGAVLGLGDVLELRAGGRTEWFLLGPAAGGTEVEVDGCEVTVITPESPLGRQLAGRMPEGLVVRVGGAAAGYRVASVI